MALIKCPECDNDISDKAQSCPNCGYELAKKSTNSSTKPKSNFNYKYLVIVLIVIVGGFFLFGNKQNTTQTPTPTTTPSTTNGYSVYTDSNLNISFEIPNDYKVTTDKEGFIYVGKNIDNQGVLIPYIIVGRYENFTNDVQFLNNFTDYMRKQYNDLKITIDLLSGNINGKLVYGLQYSYTIDNHLVIDNRYSTTINQKIYMIGSKEENTNTTEINNVVEHIIYTLKEGGM